ncbi:unnamed protein product [Prorocentrum cordatum]|uniref:Uncharacterized protein n=1 Tax=Prorocentrum cordatum TaxID=2364126 RepID=A0ABN9SBF8_9DINO|nr:unnamed protein product [Polarella glacialis]
MRFGLKMTAAAPSREPTTDNPLIDVPGWGFSRRETAHRQEEEEEEEGGHAAFEGRPPGEVAAAKCCPRRPRGPCSTARHTAGLAGTAAGVPRAHGHSLATAPWQQGALAAGAGPNCNQIYIVRPAHTADGVCKTE